MRGACTVPPVLPAASPSPGDRGVHLRLPPRLAGRSPCRLELPIGIRVSFRETRPPRVAMRFSRSNVRDVVGNLNTFYCYVTSCRCTCSPLLLESWRRIAGYAIVPLSSRSSLFLVRSDDSDIIYYYFSFSIILMSFCVYLAIFRCFLGL